MEQSQQQQRRAAAKEFIQSLNQLEDMFLLDGTKNEETPEFDSGSDDQVAENSSAIDLAAFEEAVADIEQYLEGKTK